VKEMESDALAEFNPGGKEIGPTQRTFWWTSLKGETSRTTSERTGKLHVRRSGKADEGFSSSLKRSERPGERSHGIQRIRA